MTKTILPLVWIFLVFSTGGISAQSTLITGVVVDAEGIPLPGVSVTIKNSTKGAATSMDGKYAVAGISSSDTIMFSYIGYVTQTFLIGNQSTIDVVMSETTNELEELTVVAFQKQKKESVVGSITTVKPSALKVPQANLTTALAGNIAGIISYQRSGEPGRDNAEFFIRGVTTFGYKKDPLILIDGIEVSTDDLARLEPDNVASFSIMKDATATALYGARGGNGVILVTTKTGKKGKLSISARMETSFAMPTKVNEFVDGVSYMEMYNDALRTRFPGMPLTYSKEKIENTRRGLDSQLYPNVDWYKDLFNDYVQNYKANLSATGGGDIAQYYLSVAYTNEKGLLKVDPINNFNNNISIDRFNIRSNIDFTMTKTTTAAIKFYTLYNRYNGPAVEANEIFRQVMQANPVNFPAYYQKTPEYAFVQHTLFGNKGFAASYPNPYAQMVKGYKDYYTATNQSLFQIEQDLKMIAEGLKLRGLISINMFSQSQTTRTYNPFYYQMGYDYQLMQLTEGRESLELDNNNTWESTKSNYYMEATLQYDRIFSNKHTLGGLFVFYGRELLNELKLTDVPEEGGQRQRINELLLRLPGRNNGISGRLTYNYDSRYFVEGNFGYNGSEKFDVAYRYGFFPSIGVAWIATNENFFSDQLKKKISLLKFKYTYGLVGNDAIAKAWDRFFYTPSVNINDGGKGFTFGELFNNSYNGYTVGRYANPNISWETSLKANYGFELGLYNKLNIQFDYFTDHRKNIYMPISYVPVTMGLTAEIASNSGEAKTHGVDISADFQWSVNKNWWVTARGNFTYSTNEYVVADEPPYKDKYRSKVGQPINQSWGLVAERLFVDEYDRFNSPRQDFTGGAMAGDIKYVDINGDGVIDFRDVAPIGYPSVPEIIYGFGASTGYKNFDFSFFFQGSARSSFFIDPEKIAPFVNERNALKVIADNYWSDNNPDPYAFWPRMSVISVPNNEQKSTWWLRDGSFLRLKSLEAGYSFPKKMLSKAGVDLLRIYCAGSNLLCFSKFKLWDPEMGGDGLQYPTQRVFSAGLQINF
jgi:TonB-linked SusC/RagA family outer membrane protein